MENTPNLPQKPWKVEKYNIENFVVGDYIEKTEKYEMFNQWCVKEGILFPKLKYPATFEGGLVGTEVIEDIQHREVYVYVPFHVIISLDNCKSHAVIGDIIKAHP